MKRFYTVLISLALTTIVFAQSPEKMSYQAVIRNSSDQLVTNQQVGMQISILQGSIYGASEYVEIQTPTTNANGLVTLEIGAGTILNGDFGSIDWANGPYFIKTETDPGGGTNYSITGTSQLLSVPYALHSKTAETVIGSIAETDPVYTASEAANISAIDIANLGNLSGVNTGDQDLSNFISTETDPVFNTSQAKNISATDIANLGNLSGVNTGDQDILEGTDSGQMQYWNGSAWVIIPVTENEGASLQMIGGVPMWTGGTPPPTEPDAPTIGTASVVKAEATVTFTAPANDGGSAITGYTVTSNPGGLTAIGTASPLTITGLTNGTSYTFTITATNAIGTSTESSASNTVIPAYVSDIDGNIYNIVTIGTQTWMAENLKTTKYNDGTEIPLVTDNDEWIADLSGAYCWYNNDINYKAVYGAMYNWYAVDPISNGGKDICPASWHMPSDAEWIQLTDYLGGESVAGGKLKETGTSHWKNPNIGATNETGFTAVGAGLRANITGNFLVIHEANMLLSSTEDIISHWVSMIQIEGLSTEAHGDLAPKEWGFSVRCVKD